MLKSFLFSFFLFLFWGCSIGNDNSSDTVSTSETNSDYIYYGDRENNEIVKINYKTMEFVKSLASSGINPYEVTNGFDDELLILNRSDTNIGRLKNDAIDSTYSLTFQPRSIALNQDAKTILVSSSSEPSMGLLPNNTTYNDSSYSTPTSFGGTGATGHPFWVNESYFLLLDRTENSIELYQKDSTTPVAKLSTSSSVHHLVYKNGFYYGVLEGIRNGVSPGIIKFDISYAKFVSVTEKLLSSFSNLPSDFIASTWGSHHLAFHSDAKHIYTGSYEGNVFVLDSSDLSLVDTFKAGRGIGHFLFYNDVLITTNHYDTFKSFYNVVDPSNNVLIKKLSFGNTQFDSIVMQSHTSHILDDSFYFMYNTNIESRFYKISLITYTIEDVLIMPNRYCIMGTFEKTINQHTSSM